MYKVLIVEDEINLAELLAENLKKWGYAVSYITDFNDVFSQFLVSRPDLVLGVRTFFWTLTPLNRCSAGIPLGSYHPKTP